VSYALEYGDNEVELHTDAILPGEKVWLVDDLLATGGTAEAALHLLQKLGGDIVAASFFVELTFLGGRSRLESMAPVHSVVQF
jgi:adenine phosphoribosyltransferase